MEKDKLKLLRDFIMKPESGGNPNAWNKGVAGDSKGRKRNLEDLTIKQLMEFQEKNHPDRIFASGKYQMIPNFIKEAMKNKEKYGVDFDDKYTSEVQDKLFEYAIDKRPDLKKLIKGESQDIESAMMDLAREFASIPAPYDTVHVNPKTKKERKVFKGKSYYDQIGQNAAKYSIDEVKEVLKTFLPELKGQMSKEPKSEPVKEPEIPNLIEAAPEAPMTMNDLQSKKIGRLENLLAQVRQPESETARTFQDGGMSYSDPVMNLDEGYLDAIQGLAASIQPEKRQSGMFDDMMPQQEQDFEMPLRDGTLPSELTKEELTPTPSAPERKVASKGNEDKSSDKKPKRDLVLEALKKQGKTSEEIDEETKPSLEKLYDEYQRLQGRYEKEIDDNRMGDAIVNSLGTLNRLFETGQDFKSNLGAQAEKDRSRRLAEVVRKSNLLGFGTATNQLSKDPNSPQSIAFRKQFKAMTGEELDPEVSEFMGSKLAREIVAGKRDKYRQEQISGRQEKSQDYRKDEKFIDRVDSAIKSMRGTPEFKNAQTILANIPKLELRLEDAYQKGGQSLSMLGTEMARGLAGEVGMLTDKDVTRYIKNPALIEGLTDTVMKLKSGRLSELSYDNIKRLIKDARAAAIEGMKEAEKKEAYLLAKRTNKDFKEVYDLFDTSSFYKNVNKEKTPSESSVLKDSEIRRKFTKGEHKGKVGIFDKNKNFLRFEE